MFLSVFGRPGPRTRSPPGPGRRSASEGPSVQRAQARGRPASVGAAGRRPSLILVQVLLSPSVSHELALDLHPGGRCLTRMSCALFIETSSWRQSTSTRRRVPHLSKSQWTERCFPLVRVKAPQERNQFRFMRGSDLCLARRSPSAMISTFCTSSPALGHHHSWFFIIACSKRICVRLWCTTCALPLTRSSRNGQRMRRYTKFAPRISYQQLAGDRPALC